MGSIRRLATATALLALSAVATAQAPSEADEERMDTTLRKFGYVSGQAFQCHDKAQQARLEKTALGVSTNILRLFGSDRAFFYAAAFGAGASEALDTSKCADIVRQADEMIRKLNVLAAR